MKQLLMLVTLISLSASAADKGLLGHWKSKDMKCSSGGDLSWPSQQGLKIDFKMNFEITEGVIYAHAPISFIYSKEYIEKHVAEIKESIKKVEALPDSPQKTEALKVSQEALAFMNKYRKGIKCVSNSVIDYTLEGSVMTSKTRVQTSTCPGTQPKQDSTESRAEISVNGDTLIVKTLSPVKSESEGCPVGDFVVHTFERH